MDMQKIDAKIKVTRGFNQFLNHFEGINPPPPPGRGGGNLYKKMENLKQSKIFVPFLRLLHFLCLFKIFEAFRTT